MTQPTIPDEQTIANLAARLEAYAETLSEAEREALKTIVLRAMDPIERMRWRDEADLLTERESAVLRALEQKD